MMNNYRPHIPFFYQFANALGRLFVVARASVVNLDENSVCATAERKTGLTDFGDPHYQEGLQHLLQSGKKDARLHPLGRFMLRRMVVNYLAQRLRLIETSRKKPKIFSQPLIPPIIIIGLARSGTTFLHNMLALDPGHRAIPLWQLTSPFPAGPVKDGAPDHRRLHMEQSINFRRPLLPGLDAIHYLTADSPEECINLLGLTFNSLIFPTIFPVFGYTEWYIKNSCSIQKYKEYRMVLQYYQSNVPGLRLTMKAPAHTGNVEALFTVIPEALVIQTHRDPVTCISSVSNLLKTFHGAATNVVDMNRTTGLTLDLYETWTRRNLEFRSANPAKIYDLYYDSLVEDPLTSVKDIYHHFDLPWTTEYEIRLKQYILENPKHKHGKHLYSPDDFGLNPAEIRLRLKPYIEYCDSFE